MRKTLFIFATGFVLILSAGFVSVPAAHAQLTCDPGCVEGTIDGVKGCVRDSVFFCDTGGVSAAQLTAQANANASANVQLNFGESSILNKTFAYMMSLLMTLFAWLLGVAMVTLDNTVRYLVVGMGSYVNDLSAIGVAWSILRDVGNIALIFGFLAIGITTILNVDWYGGGKKMLPMLIVAAVFLNFSLFMTEAVIDTSNLFATQFYTQINGGVPAGEKTSVLNETISSKIMSQLGFQKLYGDALTKPDLFKNNNMTLIGLLGILLFVVAAFVMFSLAFVLIARFVFLIYLMITAPLGFAGLAIPQLKGLADDWWKNLWAQTLTAPVLLLLLYIALAVITDAHFLRFGNDQNLDFLGFIQSPGGSFNLTGFASMLLSFLVAMGLLLAVVISAKKLSAFGAAEATKLAGKLSFGAAAFVGRRTVGRVSNFAARRIRTSAIGRSETGRLLAGFADRGAKASFDVRGATIAGGLKTLNVEAGAAQKGGYKAREEELIKARTEYAKSLGQSQKQKDAVKAAETAKEKAKEDFDKNMLLLEKAEQAQLKISKEVIKASREALEKKKKDLEAVRKSGNQDQIKVAETAYNNDARQHDDLKEREAEKLEPIRKNIETQKTRYSGAVAQQDIIIKDNSTEKNQEKYGRALQSEPIMKILRAPYDWTTATGSARREAAGKIISDSKKDKSQKQMDRLEAILAKADKEEKPKSEGEEKKSA